MILLVYSSRLNANKAANVWRWSTACIGASLVVAIFWMLTENKDLVACLPSGRLHFQHKKPKQRGAADASYTLGCSSLKSSFISISFRLDSL